jgi:hypothetical protein
LEHKKRNEVDRDRQEMATLIKDDSTKRVKRTVDIDPIWQRFAGLSPEGTFRALVRLSGDYKPAYMKIDGTFSPGVLKAEMPASALPCLAKDSKVLSVEFREFVMA